MTSCAHPLLRIERFKAAAPEPDYRDIDDPDFDFRRDGLGAVLWEVQQKVGPDKLRLIWCTREEAVYVSGSGVCGCIARITDITVTGVVDWPADRMREAERSALRLVGEPLW